VSWRREEKEKGGPGEEHFPDQATQNKNKEELRTTHIEIAHMW
jgi:hypothetical protein